MNNVTNAGITETNEAQDRRNIKKLLSIQMPTKGAEFSQWQQYNEQQYMVFLIPVATEEDKKAAMANLLSANMMLFVKRAKEEKITTCGIEFDDIIQIETLNFIEAIKKAADAGEPNFPSAHAFDKFGSKRRISENYSPCGIKMSYATKKRKVASDTYDMQRVSFVEEGSEAMASHSKTSGNEANSYAPEDKKLFGSVWTDELRTGLDSVLAELSDFETELLLGFANGLSNVKIAENLGISEPSVRRYVPRVIEKARKLATNNGLEAYVHDIYA